MAYVAAVFGAAIFLIFYVAPKNGTKNVLVYVCICSVVGSLTVMGCKGVGIAIKQTVNGESQLFNPVVWLLVGGVVLCITVQMNYLNKALDIFNTSMVTPIYYVMFTTFTITASAILYKEWSELNAKDALGSICGFTVIICGVFLLHAFRDIKFTLGDLYGKVSGGSGAGTQANGITNRGRNSDLNMLMNDIDDDDEDEDTLYDLSTRPDVITSKF